ncbi:MAG TPA: SDR family oxidoreductase [Myxococcota bacterium]|jgi:NAD(P)-dependent dehydrogenase (short-subunit alcohol dehydrogenase family)
MQRSGRVAFVVGAASGIGRVAARRWADAGWTLAAADIDEAGLAETARGRPRIHTRWLDVTDFEAVSAAVKEIEAQLGPIERVYNGAAIQPTGLLLEQDVREIHRVMQVNYGGLVNVSLATLPGMLERRRGVLVNFASMAGWVPNLHFGAYSASKFAQVAFTEILHHENRGKGVQILCVCPGQVDTPLRAQARSQPRVMQVGPAPQSADSVLDAVERAIGKRRLFVFGSWSAEVGWRMRRFLPWTLWRISHRVEGI